MKALAHAAVAGCLFAGAVLALPAPPARAQDATSAAAARAVFNEGVTFADAGRWSEAVVRFRRALSLRESSVIAFNLAVALTHEGHPVEAAEIFRSVIRSRATEAPLRADATAALATAEPLIAWVTITYAAPTEGLTLLVSGSERPVALVGGSVPLDAGTHEITLTRSDGAIVGRGSVSVEAGARSELTIAVIEAPAATTAAEPAVDVTRIVLPAEPPPPGDDTGIWIGVGVGGGVVLVAAVIVLVVVLVPPPEATPFSGSLGTVEIGR